MIKLIAADMDGTLLNRDRIIDSRTAAAIMAAQENGVRFVIATGRIFSDVRDFLTPYGLKCEYLTMNGAEYYDDEGICRLGIYIPKPIAKEVYAVLLRHPKFTVEFYTDRGHFSADSRRKTLKGMLRRFAARQKTVLPGFRSLWNAAHDGHFRRMQYIEDMEAFWESGIQLAKFITFGDTPSEMALLKEELASIPGIAVTSSFVTNIEINDQRATKGAALAAYIKELGILPSEVMVLGDGDNDLSMFRAFPENSVAMGNAIPELKEIASAVTEDNNHAGVAQAIEKMLAG